MGHKVVMASLVLAVGTLVGVGPLSALAQPPDPDCSKSDGNPDDGRGLDGGLCATTTTSTTTMTVATTTTSTTVATTSTTVATTSTTVATTSTTIAGVVFHGDDGSAPPGVIPVTPSGGLKAMDMHGMEPSLMAAATIVPKMGESSEPETELPEMLSVRLDHLLGPAMPPALADALVSPVVVLQALVAAMTSSSQSLLVPGVVLLFGVGLPGRRRRHPDRALTSAAPPR